MSPTLAKAGTVPYARPYLDNDDLRLVREVLTSGWLTTGKVAQAFENDFCRYVGAHAAVAVSSCTAALHVALELVDVRNRYVLVPTLTFTATAGAVIMAGGIPVLCDVDPATLTLNADQCDQAAQRLNGQGVAAVMPVHYGGNPSRFREVLAWAQARHIPVVDDAAHALPAHVKLYTDDGPGEPYPIGHPRLGAFATCYSFYPTKPITTGEGGMLVLRDAALADRAKRLVNHGIDDDAYQRSRTGLYHYKVTEHGWKYNLPDVLAALGKSQLKKADTFHARRGHVADAYNEALKPLQQAGKLALPVVEAGASSSWHLYVVRWPADRWRDGWSRDRAAERLREMGVGNSMHYVPLHQHPFWQAHAPGHYLDPARFPNAEAAYAEILSLPLWVGMTTAHVDQVVDALTQVCREGQR